MGKNWATKSVYKPMTGVSIGELRKSVEQHSLKMHLDDPESHRARYIRRYVPRRTSWLNWFMYRNKSLGFNLFESVCPYNAQVCP